MPRVTDEIQILPSVLDRLLEDAAQGRQADQHHSIRDLKRIVARDLEGLLNTRQELLDDLPADFSETSRSILMFGLPDFSSVNLASQADRNRVRRALEQTIAMFEPRLDRVRIIVDEPRAVDRGLHFRIEAVLQVRPAPEPVAFDAVLQLTTQEYRIQGQE